MDTSGLVNPVNTGFDDPPELPCPGFKAYYTLSVDISASLARNIRPKNHQY
jgi:hypothetical protein